MFNGQTKYNSASALHFKSPERLLKTNASHPVKKISWSIEKRSSYLRNRDLIWTHYWSVWALEPVDCVRRCCCSVVVVSSNEGKCCCRNLYCWRCQYCRQAAGRADRSSFHFRRPSWLASPDFRIAFCDWRGRCSTSRMWDRRSSPIRKAIRLRRIPPAISSGSWKVSGPATETSQYCD